MSDPKSNYGQPVEEPAADDDVVGRAHDSLAEAEAAQREAVDDSRRDVAAEPVDAAPAAPESTTQSADAAAVTYDARDTTTERADAAAPAPLQPETPRVDGPEATDAAAPAAASVYSDTPASTREDDDEDGRYAMYEASAAGETKAYPAEAETVVVAPADDSDRNDQDRNDQDRNDQDRYDTDRYEQDRYDTVVAAPVAAPVVAPSQPVTQQPIFVQAPEAPRARGNRAAAGAIGLLAALCFAVLYLAVALVFGAIDGFVTGENVVDTLLAALGSWIFWVPVVAFFIAFWLLGAIINRGRWGAWVIFGILVGLASYGGYILGQLFQAPFWTLTAREGTELAESQLLAPLAIAAFVIGRELTIWFGAWVAARGKRVTELNIEAQREYERTLEAGPQLARL